MNNNKSKNMQTNTAAEGDNSINTKKGFLISLPSKKKKNDGNENTSGIVMAKTINDSASTEQKAQKNKHHRDNHNQGKNQQNSDRPQKQNSPQANNIGAAENENRNGGKHGKHNNQRRDRNSDKRQNNGQHGNQQNSQQNNQKKNDNKQPANAAPKQAHENVRNRQLQEEQRRNNRKNDRRDRRDRDRNRDRDRKPQKTELPGLSPLSRDMQEFAKMSKNDISKFAGTKADTAELSLEEKYKNAIPLAEQIAAEEAKRRAKPRAMHTSKVDRSQTANALHSAAQANAQEAEDGAEHKIDFGKDYEVVGIRFREAGKVYYFDPDGREIPYGTPVIVETARGAEYGYTAISNRLVPPSGIIPPLKKIKRIATNVDTEKYHANKELEKEAAEIFKQKVAALGLEMNLVFVEYTFDNSKLLFYFTAESRIDFRELVKELAAVFRTRIELRQIGVRDEAKMLGGLGACGRSVCCNSFLGDFAQVSIKMAKDQGLSLNSAKISGACGKLMCCLRYEDKVYEEEMARTPKVGSVVETADGRGVVTEAHALKGIIKVTLENAPDSPPKAFDRADVKVVGFNKAAIKEDNPDDLKELKALEDV